MRMIIKRVNWICPIITSPFFKHTITIYVSTIETLKMFEIRHYIHLKTTWTHGQTYGAILLSIWTRLPLSSSLSHPLTHGAHPLAFHTFSLSLCNLLRLRWPHCTLGLAGNGAVASSSGGVRVRSG